MKNVLISIAAAAAVLATVPATSQAQGIAVDTPVGGVRIGEPGYRHDYREEGPVVERRVYRERDVRLGGCRTITIRDDDGYTKRIRKCRD
jgi:hypothetical protein